MPRKQGTYVPIREYTTITPGALGANTLLATAGPTMTEPVFITRSDIMVALKEHAISAAGTIGPVIFGIADKALTEAQIQEALLSVGPEHPGDVVSDERSRRRIQTIGHLDVSKATRVAVDDHVAIVVQFKHNTRLKFTEDGAGWNWWIFNMGSAALIDGSTLKVLALHHAHWLV